MLPAPAAGPHLLVADYSLHGSASVLEGSGVMVLGCTISRSATGEEMLAQHEHPKPSWPFAKS